MSEPRYDMADRYRLKMDDEWVPGAFCLLDALSVWRAASGKHFVEVVAVFDGDEIGLWGVPDGYLRKWAGATA